MFMFTIACFTPIIRVFGPFFYWSGSNSSEKLKNAIKSQDFPLRRALEAKLSFEVGEESQVHISEVGKKSGVPWTEVYIVQLYCNFRRS